MRSLNYIKYKRTLKESICILLTLALLIILLQPAKPIFALDEPSDEDCYSMTIDGKNVVKDLSANLYGLFYEDINSAADGGLYPEMVKNYSFENAYVQNNGGNYFTQNGYVTVGNYKLHWVASDASKFAVESTDSLNENNPNYAVLTGNVTMRNGGFAPQDNPNGAAMPVKPFDEEEQTGIYTFSVFAKAQAGYGGALKVKLTDDAGNALTDEQEIDVDADGDWHKLSADLKSTVSANTKGKLVLEIEGAASNDKLCLDMVSVVPHDSFGYGDPNYACGVGIRKDLLDLMMDLNPKFMRFPGGCIVEGFNWEGLYDWRDTIGPLEERKANTNRWENWNNKNRTWGYMQSYGFGYHELLSLCEEYDMEPFPIMSAGVLCQYETKDVTAKTGEDLWDFIDMATALLDYCWGNPNTNEWAKKRKDNGHEKPFNLKYLGIGNENAFAKYYDNFDVIKNEVEEFVEDYYPGHELHIISSAGPTSNSNPGGDGYFSRSLEYAYDRLAQTMPGETLVDEHYYESEAFMYNNSDRYDYYQRTDQGGSNVFVGEYAVKNDNKYNTALAEACYMTGLERNADVVTNISYAPLLYKVGSLNWSHDLIYFDEFNTAKTTNYYVQQMFANNYGTKLIRTELESPDADYSCYGSPILGTESAAGSIDMITVYDNEGNVLLEDDFNDNSNGWTALGNSGNSFSISGGKLILSETTGLNAVYLPNAVTEKWKNFKIVAEGVTKTSGGGCLIVGAGRDTQYYRFSLGKDGAGTCMEVTRRERNQTGLTTKMLGNNFINKHYNTGKLTRIILNDSMDVTFNYGVDGKLEANYISDSVSKEDTQKYDFSCDLNQYQTDIYQVVNMDDNFAYIKLVNPDNTSKDIRLNFENLNIDYDIDAEITMLKGGLNDANAIGREVVAPVTSEEPVENDSLYCNLAGYSVNVIRVPLVKPEEKPEDIVQPPADDNKPQTPDNSVKQPVNQTETTPVSATASWIGAKKVKIDWNKSNNADRYEVYRSSKKNTGFEKIASTTETSYTDKKAPAGKTSYYKIVATNGTSQSAESNIVAAFVVKAPSGLKIKVNGNKVTISFKKSAKASGYEIYRSAKKKGKFKKVATLKSPKKVKITLKKQPKGINFYKIRAYKASGGKKVYSTYSKVIKKRI